MIQQAHQEQPAHKGEYLDRKRTLPKRIVKLALALTVLAPGEYVIVVKVPTEGDLSWRQAALSGG